jgi:hypothetical protein
MSRESGGIGIGTIIFWVILANIFLSDGDEKVDVKVKVDDKPTITESVKNTIDDVKDESKKIVGNIKIVVSSGIKEYKKEKEAEKIKEKEAEKQVEKFDSDDDIYGSTEDKY